MLIRIKPILLLFLLTSISCLKEEKKTLNTAKNLNNLLTEQHGYIKIQMKQLSSGHLRLKTKVNNVFGNFILDTGSSSTIIDRKHARKFRLTPKESLKIAQTAGGRQLKLEVAHDNVIEFNQLKLRNVEISLVNLKHITRTFKELSISEIHGIIGADLLKNRHAVIDYANSYLYLKRFK